MSITINVLISTIGFVLFIVAWFNKFRSYRFLFLFLSVLSLGITFGLSQIDNNVRVSFNYSSLSIEGKTRYDDLVLENRKLTDLSGQEVSYQFARYENYSDYEPIYLADVHPEYYLVVFTRDKNEVMNHGLFSQRDYELQSNISNRLVILSKSSGLMTVVRTYDLIGKTTDIDNPIVSESIISLPVFKSYTRDVDYYFSLYVEEKHGLLSTMESIHLYAGKNRKILTYYMTDHFYFGLYDDETIEFSSIEFSFDYETYQENISLSGGSIWHRPIYTLDNEDYVKQGYITMLGEKIYLVGNDLAIYRYDGILVKIEDVINLESWIEQLN